MKTIMLVNTASTQALLFQFGWEWKHGGTDFKLLDEPFLLFSEEDINNKSFVYGDRFKAEKYMIIDIKKFFSKYVEPDKNKLQEKKYLMIDNLTQLLDGLKRL